MSFPLCLCPIISLFNPARRLDGADLRVRRTILTQSRLDPFLAGQNMTWTLFLLSNKLLTLRPHCCQLKYVVGSFAGQQCHIVCLEICSQQHNSVAAFVSVCRRLAFCWLTLVSMQQPLDAKSCIVLLKMMMSPHDSSSSDNFPWQNCKTNLTSFSFCEARLITVLMMTLGKKKKKIGLCQHSLFSCSNESRVTLGWRRWRWD